MTSRMPRLLATKGRYVSILSAYPGVFAGFTVAIKWPATICHKSAAGAASRVGLLTRQGADASTHPEKNHATSFALEILRIRGGALCRPLRRGRCGERRRPAVLLQGHRRDPDGKPRRDRRPRMSCSSTRPCSSSTAMPARFHRRTSWRSTRSSSACSRAPADGSSSIALAMAPLDAPSGADRSIS